KPGDKVDAGQRIASVSNNGVGGLHLHFEVWPGGKRTGENDDVTDSLVCLTDDAAKGLAADPISDDPKAGGDASDNSCDGDDVKDSLVWDKDHDAKGLDDDQISDAPKAGGDASDNSCDGDDDKNTGELPDTDDVTPPIRNPDGTWPDQTCSESDPTQEKDKKA